MKTYYITSSDEVNCLAYSDIVTASSSNEAYEKVSSVRGSHLLIDIEAYKDDDGELYIWTRGFCENHEYFHVTKEAIAILAQWSGIKNDRFKRVILENAIELTTI